MAAIIDNQYVFPALYKEGKTGKMWIWQANIRLVKESKNHQRGANWNMLAENPVQITQEMIDGGDLPANTVAQYWKEYGQVDGKLVKSSPTYVAPKNVGRANERNTLIQAIFRATSDINKQKDKGYRDTIKEVKDVKNNAFKDVPFHPMLARQLEKEKKHVDWSKTMAQAKLDGVRVLVFLQKGKVMMTTRGRKEIKGFDWLRTLLKPALMRMRDNGLSLQLDAEFYRHGTPRSDVNGIVNNERKNNDPELEQPQLWIFDDFYPHHLDMSFRRRQAILDDFMSGLSDEAKEHVKRLEPVHVSSKDEFMRLHKKWTNAGYEGSMLRDSESGYAGNPNSTTGTRSRSLLKHKSFQDNEFPVVGYTEGRRGDHKEAIIWICKAPNGRTFNAKPKNMSLERRHKLFQEVSSGDTFERVYKGRMLNVVYQEINKDGVPDFAYSTGFRDHQ